MFTPTELLTFLLSSVALASAAPFEKRLTTAPWCQNLGAGAFDLVTNFTLAAYYTEQPNANSTGVPLVLGRAGAIDGAEFKILSVSSLPVVEQIAIILNALLCRPLNHFLPMTSLLSPCRMEEFLPIPPSAVSR